jgi:lycopene cyclase domain-containing protein
MPFWLVSRLRCAAAPWKRPTDRGSQLIVGASWEHASYAAMLAVVLIGTLPLHRFYHLSVLRQPLRLVRSIVPVAVLFVAWDLAATAAGQWRFDAAQTFSVRLWGLPLEEYAFFVVIPLAAILTFEAVTVVRSRRRAP